MKNLGSIENSDFKVTLDTTDFMCIKTYKDREKAVNGYKKYLITSRKTYKDREKEVNGYKKCLIIHHQDIPRPEKKRSTVIKNVLSCITKTEERF